MEIYSQGEKMFSNLSLPGEGAPGVLMSHGFASSKDGDKWVMLAPLLFDAGFASLRFSYRGCGEGEEKSEGNFEDTTLSRRIADYNAAINFFQNTGIDASRLGVIGSSFGGTVVLAARDKQARAMVILATPANIRSRSEKELKQAKQTGYFELDSGRRLRTGFYEDMRRYNITDAVKEIHCPLLIIHGSQDEVVPVDDAHALYRNANEPKRLEIIDGANHALDEPEHLNRVVHLSLEWFKTYLRSLKTGRSTSQTIR